MSRTASHAWRAIQWILGVTVIALAVRTLARNWAELRSQAVTLDVRPGYLLAAAAITWVMYAMLITSWRVMLASWGQRLDPISAARIWLVSNLGKYLPGKVWALAGMTVLAQRAGVAPWAAAASAVVLQAVGIGTGAALVGWAGAVALEAAHPGTRAALLSLVLASAVAVGLVLWPPAARRLLRLAGVDAAHARPPSASAVALGIASNLVAWVGYGIALVCLARGLLPAARLDLVTAIGAFTASYLAGLLALVAPGGIGVREGVMILLLQTPLGLAAATMLALASRVLLTITELAAAAPFLALSNRSSRVPQ
ncbi:MAG TPA: lysylphosphatidylglycerol synthase domain-containing protein [Gemmatimonadales bacterium]|nr:lysylphosphatidylglycerol synthase domain-containing protein [Gemmatimonadales bacterium]